MLLSNIILQDHGQKSILAKLAGYSGAKTTTELMNDTAMYKRKTLSLFKG